MEGEVPQSGTGVLQFPVPILGSDAVNGAVHVEANLMGPSLVSSPETNGNISGSSGGGLHIRFASPTLPPRSVSPGTAAAASARAFFESRGWRERERSHGTTNDEEDGDEDEEDNNNTN